MTDEAKLRIAALRWAHLHGDCNDEDNTCPVQDECLRCTNVLCNTRTAADLIESLSAELERVKRERDAAVMDLEACCPCEVCTRSCTYDKVNAYGECADFEWRGVKEGSHD